ncbi:hypothetical protein B4090_4657 [Bacillus licheniformis]|nr:hypothetical protein B4090_4657 [Bacillus licheniformis]OLF97091.1 hypothetical protein B4094_0484 [Bacillus licheniformis]TWK62493.1 hypothetical protein CHCC20344_0700 [Bacillus licheniformis]TWK65968.1 hypothetical protein CHCC20341_2979 [Bacillus licheniformis]TWM78402.1 hypothetical protein CHCC14688_1105 [Bacillus licheniformis]
MQGKNLEFTPKNSIIHSEKISFHSPKITFFPFDDHSLGAS